MDPRRDIIVAHDHAQVLRTCDRVNLLRHGRITVDRAAGETSLREPTKQTEPTEPTKPAKPTKPAEPVVAEYRARRKGSDRG